MKPDTRGLYRHLLSIKTHATELRDDIDSSTPATSEVWSILTEYNDALGKFEKTMEREKIEATLRHIIRKPSMRDDDYNKAVLQEVEIECEKGAEVLASLTSPLPAKELDRLQSLREELKTVSAELNDMNYERNLAKAIDEYEAGHTLASALISSRVIIYALDRIPGKEAEDKVKFLDEKKIIDKKGKDPGEFILKANKKARNFFSHDIKAFPDSSDALSLLGDTIAMLRIIVKLEEASTS